MSKLNSYLKLSKNCRVVIKHNPFVITETIC